MVRNYLFRIVQLFAFEKEDRLEEMLDYLEDIPDFGAALDDYFDEYDDMETGPEARGKEFFRLGDTSGSFNHARVNGDQVLLNDTSNRKGRGDSHDECCGVAANRRAHHS